MVWFVSAPLTERALVVAQLEEEGFDARGFESLSDLYSALALAAAPDLIVLDLGTLEVSPAKREAIRELAPETRVLDVWRPASIAEVIAQVRQALP